MPVISTNIAANSAVRYLNINSAAQTSSLSKLASGSRITQASDDAAGLAISTKISSDVTALNQAATNASHGVSVLQTADGGASNISDILQRMKALASQAASGTVGDTERGYIDTEFQQLIDEIDAISVGTRYNGASLLDGTFAATDVMVGSDETDVINITLDDLDATALAVNALAVATQAGGVAAMTAIDTAISTVSDARANIGALESRFGFHQASIATSVENLTAAVSAIKDTDVAVEASKLASAKVKTQAAVAAAAQASQMPQDLLKLLQ
jgi:flagellin